MEEGVADLINVHIAESDCVTSLGESADVLWNSLSANKCGFAKVQRFETINYVNNVAGCIGDLDAIAHGMRFSALLEKLCDRNFNHDDNTVLLTATTKDNIELHESYVRQSPTDSSRFSACSMVDFLADRLKIKRTGHNVNTACTSASSAILWAAEMIRNGETNEVAVWAADMVSEFVFSGFSALKVMSPNTSRPFDANRDGLILGEAAGYIILISEEKLLQQKRTSLGIIKGWGISSDAHHITAPDREGTGLQRAINNAIKKATIGTDDLAAISAHGTGTVHNDAMEITAFNNLFAGEIPPVFSIKGAIGHCLGSCGLVEVSVASRAIAEQEIPPTTGSQKPEQEIAGCITTGTQKIDGRYILSTNSGFGGINTALVLEAI
jgi:3-oxoacyl-[acyl-carrier-protein] synthase II